MMAQTQQSQGFGSTWHHYVLIGLGVLAMVALAGPYPAIATWIVALLIVLVLLSNWPVYQKYLGL
jgi:hypothetical protein